MTTTQISSPALHAEPAVGDDVALVAAGEDNTSTGTTALPVVVVPVDQVPADPMSLDATRPDDFDACPVCAGLGGLSWVTNDPYDGAIDGDLCWSCEGTGRRGAA